MAQRRQLFRYPGCSTRSGAGSKWVAPREQHAPGHVPGERNKEHKPAKQRARKIALIPNHLWNELFTALRDLNCCAYYGDAHKCRSLPK